MLNEPKWVRVTSMIVALIALGLLAASNLTSNRDLLKAGWYLLGVVAVFRLYQAVKASR